MIEWFVNLIHTVLGYRENNKIMFFLYWLPLGICVVGYFFRTWREYQDDVVNRDKAAKDPTHHSYHPELVVGHIIGRALMCWIPIANIFAAVFGIMPDFFGDFFRTLAKTFNQPLVPPKKS